MTFSIGKPLYYSLFFFALALAFREGLSPYADFDLWLHLFIGKETISNSLNFFDNYSFTATGSPVFNHEWLSQVLISKIFLLFGDLSLFAWKIAFFVGILTLIWIAFKNIKNDFSRVVLFILCIVSLRPGISFRLQIFSYLFLTLLIVLEEGFLGKKLSGERFKLYFYPFLFLFWANIHGAFLLGLAVLGLYTITSDRGIFLKKSLVLVLAIFATFINPYGVDVYFYIFHEITLDISKEFITEWQPFSFNFREIGFFVIFIYVLIGSLFCFKIINFKNLTLFVVAIWLGFGSVRNTPLVAIMGLPILVSLTNRLFLKEGGAGGSHKLYSLISIPLFCMGIFMLSTTNYVFKVSIEDDNYPVRSVGFLKSKGIKGNLALPLHWGGYSLFHLYPNMKVSIDGRWATVYNEKIMQTSNNLSYRSTNRNWEKILSEMGADYFIAEIDNPAISEFKTSQNWSILFIEDGAVLLKKN